MGSIKDWDVSKDFHGWVKKAEMGDIDAQFAVAQHIIYELHPDNDEKELIDKAVKYYRNAAMSGYYNGIAAEELGSLYYEGKYVERDYNKAIMWFRTSINKLMPTGYFNLGRCFYYGHGVEKDLAKAFDLYFKGAMTGYINNYVMLADMYKNGEFVDKDAAFAVKLYQYVYDLTLSEYKRINIWSDAYGLACLRLGAAYLFGVGAVKNIDETNYLLSEAKEHAKGSHWANVLDTDAETKKLLSLLDGVPYTNDFNSDASLETEIAGVASLSDEEFTKLIAERLPKYELEYYPEKELNELYALNPKITKFGHTHFRKILDEANTGNPKKMYEMATICYQGDKNCPKNPTLKSYAMDLYHKSLIAGCRDALEILGLCYYHGCEVPQSYETALFLFGLSEYPFAFSQIGVCYSNGNGVHKDYLKAYNYYIKMLLLEPDKGGITYDNIAIIYPHLTCFEKDAGFLDYCREKAVKTETDDYGEF